MTRSFLAVLLGAGLLSAGRDPDFQLLLRIHEAVRAETALAELARTRSQNPEIKVYADRLIDDGKTIDRTVTDRASSRDWSLSGERSDTWLRDQANLKEEIAVLRVKGGEAFDREFLTHSMADQERLIGFLHTKLDTIADPAFHDEIKGIHDKLVADREDAKKRLPALERRNTRGE